MHKPITPHPRYQQDLTCEFAPLRDLAGGSGLSNEQTSKGGNDAVRIFHDAVSSARKAAQGRPRMEPSGDPLARRAGLHRMLDRRTSYRAVGTASLARSS